jgi:hypothetical protein
MRLYDTPAERQRAYLTRKKRRNDELTMLQTHLRDLLRRLHSHDADERDAAMTVARRILRPAIREADTRSDIAKKRHDNAAINDAFH